jgi:hypothetical protein
VEAADLRRSVVFRGMAQPGSAEVLGTSGRRFESCCPDQIDRAAARRSSAALMDDEERARSLMTAKIYCPAPRPTQSAPGDGKIWVLRYEASAPRMIDPLMGWTSSRDMKTQIKLKFATKEEAIAYAERNGVPYRLEEPKLSAASRRVVSYADNFKTTRIGQWTH